MNSDCNDIDELLEELRHAGPNPKPELLASIAALGEEGIPPLIAMVSNPAEYEIAEGDEAELTGWAPYGAVSVLGELHPPAALEPLLSLITWDDYDYLAGILPDALARYGRAALDPLTAILADRQQTVWTRWRSAEAMEKMASVYPELRDEIVSRLTAQLDTGEPETEELDVLRGGLVSGLVELEADESIPSIVRTFEETTIDPYMISWSDVRSRLAIPSDVAPHLDETAPRRQPLLPSLLQSIEAAPPLGVRGADMPYRRQTPKIGRNDPCPCGSGKKYKKCHGR